MTDRVVADRMSAPIWSVGFRIFFLACALNTMISLGTWLAFLSGLAISTQGWPPHYLHAHEMLHGTVVPAIAGFLLTAVPNWCGSADIRGEPVVGLATTWLLGRLALASTGLLPREAIAMIDGAFLPMLAIVVGVPIYRARQFRNFPVIFVLLALTAANAAMHVGLIQSNPALLRTGLYGSVYLVIFLVLMIGGRILPNFTRVYLRRIGRDVTVESNRRIGAAGLVAGAFALLLDLWHPGGQAGGLAALVAAPLIAARQAFWKPHLSIHNPILWILHVGHAWIAIGFACHAAAVLIGAIPVSAALHSFTAGAMGCMILGMISRVTLGHTGRPVAASRLTTLAYSLVTLAAVVRVFGPSLVPSLLLPVFMLSGTAFVASYMIYLIEYAPILWHPGATQAGK